jgi:hypothetical protein
MHIRSYDYFDQVVLLQFVPFAAARQACSTSVARLLGLLPSGLLYPRELISAQHNCRSLASGDKSNQRVH